MSFENKSIALIFGGRGWERDISVKGASYLYTILKKEILLPIFISPDGVWKTPTEFTVYPYPCMSFSEILEKVTGEGSIPVFPYFDGKRRGFITEGGSVLSCSSALPLLHGEWGEDGTVQGALECAEIPYVGCRVTAGALCIDKVLTKAVASSLGISIAPFVTVDSNCEGGVLKAADEAEEKIGYPMFVKPIRLGSSVGASGADCREELIEKIGDALATGGGAMIEKRIDVLYEAECALYKTKDTELISDVGGITTAGGFYDYGRKYSSEQGATVHKRIDISGEQRDLIRRYVKVLSDTIGIRHLGRFDFFITRDGEVIFNEINTFPGFTEGSLWPRLITDAGLDPCDAILGMIEDSLR